MNLLYSIAFGFHAYHQAKLMVRSMRELGKFTGEIIIYTDTNVTIEGATTLYRPEFGEIWTIMGLRWTIGASEIDLSKYEYVAMIDTDVVAIGDVNELFHGPKDCVRVPEEERDGRIASGHSPWSIYGVPFDTSKPVYNCGTVFGHSSSWKQFSTTMWELIRHYRPEIPFPYQWIDQQILNHIERQSLFPVKMLPTDLVYICQAHRGIAGHTKMVHCIPGGKEKLHVMQAVYSLALK